MDMNDVSSQGSKWNPIIAKRPFAHSKVTFDKRPFPHSQVTFESKRKKRPFGRLQPLIDSNEDEDDGWLDWLNAGLSNKRDFANAAIKRSTAKEKRPFILSTQKFDKRPFTLST